ncbi:MAG: hypothetical protein IID37_09890 [Planctomycetes bacterium]|nr:hypothetical protein [Planctomycetota bacterium]
MTDWKVGPTNFFNGLLDPRTEPTIPAEHFRELQRLPQAVEWSTDLRAGLAKAEKATWTM